MARPAVWQVVFSFKAFAAAMLALFIAFSLDLRNPYWALTTVYVVSQPFAGAIRSKASYRLAGTLLGASVGVALYAVFGTAQLAMIGGLVGWFCLCGYFAMSDRSPRSYFFLLAGMTALLVAWPGGSSSSASMSVFDTAVARTEEIGLGILCAVFVDSIFFPRRIGPMIDAEIRKWFGDARTWSLDVLAGRTDGSAADRRRLAADANQIGIMAVHLGYETAESPARARWVDVLRQRMLMIMPVLSSIDDRLSELRRDGRPVPDDLARILDRLSQWLEAGAPAEETARLRAAIRAVDAPSSVSSDWREILVVSILDRLHEFVGVWSDCTLLWNQFEKPQRTPPRRAERLARQKAAETHRDRGLVAWGLGTALLAFAVSASFWYLTGWPQGSTATVMTLLMSLFFGSIDNPLPILRMMIKVLVFATIVDVIYVFMLMPMATSFPMLALLFAPTLIPLGILASNPATFMVALMPIAMMTFQDTASAPAAFEPFVNGMVGTITGVTVVLVVTGIAKAVSAEKSASRILQAGWRDIERIAGAAAGADRSVFTAKMLDRLGLLVPRLAALDSTHSLATTDALLDLRLGLNLIELQRRRHELSGVAAENVTELLDGISRHYRAVRDDHMAKPPAALLETLDDALASVGATEVAHKSRIILILAGVRRVLFPDAPAYRPPLEPAAFVPVPLAMAAE